MGIDATTLLTILGMALVTYATRVGGVLVMGRLTLSRPVERWLSYIPGAILISIVVPSMLTRGPSGIAAGIVTALVAMHTHNLFLAMLCGVAVAWVVQTLL